MKFLSILALLFLTPNLIAQTIISFDNPIPAAPTTCSDTWSETGIDQSFVPIPPGTSCGFDYSSGDLWLFSGRLILDLTPLSNITSIEIELIDWCDIGCTDAEFFANGNLVGSAENTITATTETITYTNTNMDAIDEMTIQSFENQMFQITIFTDPLCDETADPEITVEDGDIYLEDACNGIILTSPNGDCYRVKVNNNGELTTTVVTCP